MNKRQYSDALQQIKLALAVCDDDQRVHWWKFKLVHQMHSHPQQHVL